MRTHVIALSMILLTAALYAADADSKATDAKATKDSEADKTKEIIAKQLATYPLKTCVVSGGKLGEMGDPIDYLYKDRLVRFCCKGCIKKFEKDPDKYLAVIDEAAKKAADKNAPAPSGDEKKADPNAKSGAHDHGAGGDQNAKSGGHDHGAGGGHGGGCCQ